MRSPPLILAQYPWWFLQAVCVIITAAIIANINESFMVCLQLSLPLYNPHFLTLGIASGMAQHDESFRDKVTVTVDGKKYGSVQPVRG